MAVNPPKLDKHPADAVLRDFALGRLAPADAARVEAHFLHCQRCGEQLGRVANDTYCDLIKGCDDTPVPEGPAFPELPAELRNHPRYAIERKLGAGGMGVVYQASHRLMRRSVALKMIRPELVATPIAVSRFKREAQTAARLSHVNIVTAHDADEVSGVHILVMEFVEGVSLERLVQTRGPLPPAEAIGLVLQVVEGLIHAHELGMIHRDIKPANLMVTPAGTVKILDFGLACWTGPTGKPLSLTHTGAKLGTVNFAAPEQLRSADSVDARADQYSLGATLAYLVSGLPPRPSEPILPATVSDKMASLIRKLMAENPANRFASIAEAAVALADCRPKPRANRRRALLLLGAGGLLAAFVLRPRHTVPVPPVIPKLTVPPVLFLLPSHGLWHEDYAGLRTVLEAAGISSLVATPDGSPSLLHENSLLGKADRPTAVTADIALSQADPSAFSAVVCVGFEHDEYTNNETATSLAAMQLLRRADRAEKLIVGVCVGQKIVGAAGLLHGVRVCRASEFVDDPAGMGAVPQPEAVVVDGRVLTVSTFQHTAEAGATLVRLLSPSF